jgi:ribosomal protein S18 acetylase RimI-like enzyme
MRRSFMHDVPYRSQLDPFIEAHPEFVLEDGDNLLAAVLAGDDARLAYAFENERVFATRFPAMLEMLLPRMEKAGASRVRVSLSYNPARPLVEPVLKRLSFRPRRDWIKFSLERNAAKSAGTATPSGVRFRDAADGDKPELARIDAEAFPDTPLTESGMRQRIGDAGTVLVAMRGSAIAGFSVAGMVDEGVGYIYILAVRDEERGSGIGSSLIARVCKRLFKDGAGIVELRTDADNGDAIRLYVRLGFKQTAAGREYARPVNERELRQMEKRDGVLIRFGGWR